MQFKYAIMRFQYVIMQFKYAIMQFEYVIMQLCYFAHFGSPGGPTLLTELKQKGKRPGFYFLYLITWLPHIRTDRCSTLASVQKDVRDRAIFMAMRDW